jgi:hypothetical protein
MRASTNLHNTMFSGITQATMWFFNNNPSGNFNDAGWTQVASHEKIFHSVSKHNSKLRHITMLECLWW